MPGFSVTRAFKAGVFGKTATGVTYLLRDEFTTADDAPITSPRTCEPGPGALTAIQTGGQFAIAGGKLDYSGVTTNTWSDFRIYCTTGRTRAAGLTCLSKILITNVNGKNGLLTWRSAVAGDFNQWIYGAGISATYPNSLVFILPAGALTIPVCTIANGVEYDLALILRSTGAFVLIKGGSFSSWTLLYISITNTTATLYEEFVNYDAAGTLDSLRTTQLPAPWNTDNGIATNATASPGVGAISTMIADGIVEFTWSAVTNETLELDVRRTDADNRWIVRCSQSGSTIKLIERNAGVETERSSAAQTWTNGTGYRIIVICDGATIKTFVANAVKNSYTSATFNQTATGVKTSHAGANLICWPRALAGTALSTLAAV